MPLKEIPYLKEQKKPACTIQFSGVDERPSVKMLGRLQWDESQGTQSQGRPPVRSPPTGLLPMVGHSSLDNLNGQAHPCSVRR